MELQHPHSNPLLRLPPGSVERSNILHRWLAHRTKTCHLLLGQAGSGKTTLALQLRRHLVNEGFGVAWMSVLAGDEPDLLMESLFCAFHSVAPTICQETHLLYNRDRTNFSSSTIAISLIKGIEHHGRDVLLAVDDYHNVTHPQAHAMLQTLLEYAPRNLHVLILSRSVPPLSFERLRSAHQLYELDTQDLRFTQKEVEEFLKLNAPSLDREAVLGALHLTDGWIAGLQLFALMIKTKPKFREWQQSVRNVPEFNNYFEQEVLAHLPLEILEGLVQLSPARKFNRQLTISILGPELGHSLLSLLEKERMFIMPADTDRGQDWWRFHPLFREILLSRFSALPVKQQQLKYISLGRWFGDHGHIRDAVQHLVAANDVHQAAEYLERNARALFLNGELQRLVRAISEVPRSFLRELHSLTLWLGWAQLCYGQLDACHDSVARIEHYFSQDTAILEEERNRSNQAAHVCLLRFSLALQVDDQDQAKKMLSSMHSMHDQNDAVLQGGRRNLLAWFYSHQQSYEKARHYLAGPGYYLDDGKLLLDSSFGSMMSAFFYGLTYLLEGDFKGAEASLRATLANSEKLLGRHCEAACNAAGLLAEVLFEIGDLPALRSLLDDYFDAIERVALPDARLSASLAKSRLHAFDGHMSDAHNVLARMENMAHERQMLRVTAVLLLQHFELALRESDPIQSQEYLVTLKALSDRATRNGHFAASNIELHLTLASAQSDLRALRYHNAFNALSCLLIQNNIPKVFLLKAQALRITCQWCLGNRTEAEQAVKSVLMEAQTYGIRRTLLDVGSDFPKIIKKFYYDNKSDPLVSFYMERVIIPMMIDINENTESGDEKKNLHSLSEREADIFRLLANSLPNKRIAQALGISPETVKWHLKNIYGKLGLSSRDDAISFAKKNI